MSVNHLTRWLSATSTAYPDNIAIITASDEISWLALQQRALSAAHYLKSCGVSRGDRILIWLPNGIDFVVSFWATQYLQAVFVPVNPETPPERVPWLLNDAEAQAIIADGCRAGLLDALQTDDASSHTASLIRIYDRLDPQQRCSASLLTLEQLAALPPSETFPCTPTLDVDLACLIYTSGSTGNPKGVMLTQRNMLSAATSVSTYLELAHSDRIYCTIPMSFDYGLYQAIMAARVGASLVIERDFTRPIFALSQIAKYRATVFPIVPSLLALIVPLASRYDFSSIRKITNTAAALHPADIDKLMHIFPQADIYSMYGLTECHRCTWLPPAMLKENKESVGYAIPNTELWVVDDQGHAHTADATGELVIRGATVMSGYWRNEAQTKKKLRPGPIPGEQVLYTGDICHLDKNGLLYFVARLDDMLKSCGEKVAPKEVEGVIKRFPGVSQVAVMGLPHAIYGDEIVACIEADNNLDLTQLKAFCKLHLEGYKCPHRYFIDTLLPRNPNGKIDKNRLMTSLLRQSQQETL